MQELSGANMKLCNSDEASLEFFLTLQDLQRLPTFCENPKLYSRQDLKEAAINKYGKATFMFKKYSRHATLTEAVEEYFLTAIDVKDLPYVNILGTKYFERKKLLELSVNKYGWLEFQKKIKDLSARDEGFLAIPVAPCTEADAKMEPEESKVKSEPAVKAEAESEILRKRRSRRNSQPEAEEEPGEGENPKEETDDASGSRQDVRGRRKKAKRAESQYATGRWLEEEHQLFLIGLKRYGRSWCLYKDLVKTRSAMQIRTHAQKFFKRIGGYIPEVHGMTFSEEDIQKKIAKLERVSTKNQKGSGSSPVRGTRMSKRVKTRKLMKGKKTIKSPQNVLKATNRRVGQHDKEEELAAAGFLSLQRAVVL